MSTKLVVGEFRSLESGEDVVDILIRYNESDGRYNVIIQRDGEEITLPFHRYTGILHLVGLPQEGDYV